MNEQPAQYQSKKIIVEAPFSFTGATKRIWPLTNSDNAQLKYFVLVPSVILLLCVCYLAIATWYAMFGLLLVPYRLMRRSQRKNKLRDAQHAELLAATRGHRI